MVSEKFWVSALGRASVGAALFLVPAVALAKDYKSGECISNKRFGFGAFEARIRAAKGPGAVSTFFLWKPGSEQASVPWEEIDFELGIAAGDYQTQIMTPGPDAPMYRTEHVTVGNLGARPWDYYYTYRIEWTPSYIAFFIDGVEVRRETNQQEYAALFNTDSSGDTPVNERMELRTGVWPGASNIASWSGVFDGSSVPTGHFVDYVKVWDYTPNQSNEFSTLLLDEQFNQLNSSAWYFAQWTFEFSLSDYVSRNVGAKDGRLVVALTTNAGQGILPNPPPDVPPPPPRHFVVEAEKYADYYDTTPGNSGEAKCSTTDVDAQGTFDTGGGCNIGWTAAGEWLEYDVTIARAAEYDLTLRVASNDTGNLLRVEVDGVDVSGPLAGPGAGFQEFRDVVVPAVYLAKGAHVLRLEFDGEINVNYVAFDRLDVADPCSVNCDDEDPCTTDSCDPAVGCVYQNNTAACASDNNACTDDVCSAGVCTHVANGSCSTGSPCSGLCSNPVAFNKSFSSGNLGTSATCHQTSASLSGGVCGNLASGRKLTVNGVQMSCNSNWPNPLPAKRNGGYCVQTTAGNYAWAYFSTW